MAAKNFSHENFDRIEKVKLGSDRNFGLTFSAFFMLLAVGPLFLHHHFRPWAFVLSIICLIVAMISPQWFKSLNIIWTQLGLLLNRIVSPVVLAILFFLVFTPMGYLLRFFKKDILDLAWSPQSTSYWIASPENTAAETSSMRDQF
jgi:hypothetical protein